MRSFANPRRFRLDSAEEVLLQKLNWYKANNKVLDKQWLDALGILKSQKQLDYAYLEQWAAQLGLSDLVARAREESGRA